MDKHVKEIFGVNLFYMLIGIALLAVGSLFQERNLIIGLLQTELIVILLPSILYMKIRKISLKDIKVNRIKTKDILWVIIATMLFYPIGLFLNVSFNFIIGFFIEFPLQSTPIPQNLNEYLIYVPVISLSAGICEEVLFRGVIMKEYNRLGAMKSIVITAFLFGIFHFNLQNLIGPIVLGILFGYMVYKTNSLFAGIIGHATNNLIALTLGYLVVAYTPDVTEEIPTITEPLQMLFPLIFWGMFAFICMQILKKVIYKIGDEKEELIEPKIELKELKKYVWSPIVIVIVTYITIMVIVY